MALRGIEYHGQSGGQSWVSLGSIKAQSGVSQGLIGTIQVLVWAQSGVGLGSIGVNLESSGVGQSRFDLGSVQAQSTLSTVSVQAQSRLSPGSVRAQSGLSLGSFKNPSVVSLGHPWGRLPKMG